jgi:hypothetical protein
MAGASILEIRTGDMEWRCRSLDPVTAADAGMLWQGALSVLTSQADMSEYEDRVREAARHGDDDALRKALGAYHGAKLIADRGKLDDTKAADLEARVLLACVQAIRVVREEGDVREVSAWSDCRLVREQSQQDPKAGRLWVWAIPADTRSALLAGIMDGFQRAKEALRPFRPRPTRASRARPVGQEVPDHAPSPVEPAR